MAAFRATNAGRVTGATEPTPNSQSAASAVPVVATVKPPAVGLARVLPGAVPFKEGNINDTYRALIELSDGSTIGAIVKDLEAKELANELFAAVLADALDLPVPRAFLAAVDPGDLAVTKGPANTDGDRLVFASADVAVPNVFVRYSADPSSIDALLGGLTAWPNLGRLYGFDSWIANVDRHAGNLLFGSGGEAWLIDHGWSFTGRPNWTVAELDAKAEYQHRLTEWLTDRLTQGGKEMRAKQAAGLESDLPALDLLDAINASMATTLLSTADVAAVVKFLRDRISQVAYYSNKALKVPTIV